MAADIFTKNLNHVLFTRFARFVTGNQDNDEYEALQHKHTRSAKHDADSGTTLDDSAAPL